MSESDSPYVTTPIGPADAKSGFSCGKRPLDDYFARHSVPNDAASIGRAYVLRRGGDALIGRLAIDHRAQGRRLGEKLLLDALHRVVDAATLVGCTGIIMDAKDEESERFYVKYDFVTVTAEGWPRRMFLPIATARAAFADD